MSEGDDIIREIERDLKKCWKMYERAKASLYFSLNRKRVEELRDDFHFYSKAMKFSEKKFNERDQPIQSLEDITHNELITPDMYDEAEVLMPKLEKARKICQEYDEETWKAANNGKTVILKAVDNSFDIAVEMGIFPKKLYREFRALYTMLVLH